MISLHLRPKYQHSYKMFNAFFSLCSTLVVNKLLCPELAKTNQICDEDICISWGTGLDLEVISYVSVFSRRQCNVSLSSTFNCSLCERGLLHGRRSERGSMAPAVQKPNTLGWDLTRMEPHPCPSTRRRDQWEKFSCNTDTNSGAGPVLESG